MDDMNIIVAKNLKQIREQRKLSLEKLADLTGVSKSMLGQIERGESSPTIQTVWKIANGLKISFTSLIDTPKDETLIVKKDEISPIFGDSEKFKIYPVFPFDADHHFEILNIELERGAYSSSEPHKENTEEFVMVYDGELTIRVNNDEYTIKAGDSIRYRADREHSYHNSGSGSARICMVIYYPD